MIGIFFVQSEGIGKLNKQAAKPLSLLEFVQIIFYGSYLFVRKLFEVCKILMKFYGKKEIFLFFNFVYPAFNNSRIDICVVCWVYLDRVEELSVILQEIKFGWLRMRVEAADPILVGPTGSTDV